MEYYERDVLVRAEEDTDADGKVDKWETYDGARLASVALDTSHRGVPDRRLINIAGIANQILAERAQSVVMMVSGVPLRLR